MAARREDVASRVRDALASTTTSRSDLSDQLGVSLATISRWASGASSPSPERWPQLEHVLGVRLSPLSAPDDLAALHAQLKTHEARIADLEFLVQGMAQRMREMVEEHATLQDDDVEPSHVGSEPAR